MSLSQDNNISEAQPEQNSASLVEEKEPLNEGNEEANGIATASKTAYKEKNFLQRFKTDPIFQKKFINTVFLWWSFASLGWAAAQFGPTFLDLQRLTNTNLNEASVYMTIGAVGYLVGSLIAGFLFRRINTHILLVVVCLCFGVLTVIIPWCTMYEVMILVLLLRGITGGMQDTAGNSQLLRTWGSENESYMQALHFFFAFGGIISPLASAPFLSTIPHLHSTNSTDVTNITTPSYIGYSASYPRHILTSSSFETSNYSDTEYFSLIEKMSNVSYPVLIDNTTKSSTVVHKESRFYIAYLITAVLYFSAGILFIVSFCITNKTKQNDKMNEKNKNQERKLPLLIKILVLINVLSLMALYCAIEESFASFLTTFLVKQLNWTKSSGAYATSMFWASFCVGRFLGIFLVRCLKPFTMILCCFIMLHIVYVGIIISSIWNFDAGVWIFVTVAGLAMSVTFPTIFSWTDENLLPVAGVVVSLLMLSASVGGMVNPLALGHFMEHVTPMYFCYIPLGECILFICLFFVAFCFSRKTEKYLNSDQEHAVEVDNF